MSRALVDMALWLSCIDGFVDKAIALVNFFLVCLMMCFVGRIIVLGDGVCFFVTYFLRPLSCNDF